MVMRPRKAPKGESPRDTIKTQVKTINDLCERLDVLRGRLSVAEKGEAEWRERAEASQKEIAALTEMQSNLLGQVSSLQRERTKLIAKFAGYRQHVKDLALPAKINRKPLHETAGAGAAPEKERMRLNRLFTGFSPY